MGALPYDLRRHHLRGQEGRLIPLLQEAQRQDGFLKKARLAAIGKETGVPLSQVYGVASFYAQFRFVPMGKHLLKVCHGTACHVSGAPELTAAITDHLKVRSGETTPDGLVTVETVSCLGCCSLAPVLMLDETTYGNLSPASVRKVLRTLKPSPEVKR